MNKQKRDMTKSAQEDRADRATDSPLASYGDDTELRDEDLENINGAASFTAVEYTNTSYVRQLANLWTTGD